MKGERAPAVDRLGLPYLNGFVVVDEIDVTGPSTITLDKLFVVRGSFVFHVARQHALDAHADTLCTLDRTPALIA